MSGEQRSLRVAVIGAGVAGLACARELDRQGSRVVLFEAEDRWGGRCSAQMTPVGAFDDGAQFIGDHPDLSTLLPQLPGRPAALLPWTIARAARDEDGDDDGEDSMPMLHRIGWVGAPSMRSFADALAQGLDIRLRTPIREARRSAGRWTLHDDRGAIGESFDALVLALPAPLAAPLAQASPTLAAALAGVEYRSRWAVLLGTARPLGLPVYGEYHGSPIERVAAIHAKPGRGSNGSQERWFFEADGLWSDRHADADEISVTELMLPNIEEHAQRHIVPNLLAARRWRYGAVTKPALCPPASDCLWDEDMRLGVCGDSLVPSRLDRVFDSGIDLAHAVVHGPAVAEEHARPRAASKPAPDLRVPPLSSFTDREDKRRRMVLLV